MNIGQAVAALKAGQRVRRAGWNGKNMWLCYMPELFLRNDQVNERTKKHIGDHDMDCRPYIVMWTAKQQWQPGWLCSQDDLLAEDWEVIE